MNNLKQTVTMAALLAALLAILIVAIPEGKRLVGATTALKVADSDIAVLEPLQLKIENLNYRLKELINQAVTEATPETRKAISEVQTESTQTSLLLKSAFEATLKKSGLKSGEYGIDMKAKLFKQLPK